MKKIVLIGAGLTGPLLAYYLSRRGFKVEIYERYFKVNNRRVSIIDGMNIKVDLIKESSTIFEKFVRKLFNTFERKATL